MENFEDWIKGMKTKRMSNILKILIKLENLLENLELNEKILRFQIN